MVLRRRPQPDAPRKCSLPTVLPPLLALPLELRQHIYSYLVPYTIMPDVNNPTWHVWVRRSVVLLRVCKQIHHEFKAVMHDNNTWTFDSNSLGWLISRPRMGKNGPEIWNGKHSEGMTPESFRRVVFNIDFGVSDKSISNFAH